MKEKRSGTICPLDDELIVRKLVDMWTQGWLDDFAEEHFLIRAIHNDNIVQKKMRKKYPICTPEFSYEKSNMDMTFCINFAAKIQLMCDVFGEDEIKKFVKNQLSAGKKHYNENTFFEALTEIEILVFFIQFGPGWATGFYEPQTGKGKHNPEASLKYEEGTRIDIEVKTPEFRVNTGNADIYMPLHCLTKEGLEAFEKVCKKYYATFQCPRVSKLKSFIDSACEKFETPVNDKHYNILFINWTYTEIPVNGFIEPVSLLGNPYNGIFTHRDMASKVGITEELYSKITAIFVFQNPMESIVFHDLRYLFATRQATLLLNPFLLDTEEKREQFHRSIQMYKRDFVMDDIPELYYSVNGYYKSYITNQLRQVINENRA